MSAATQKPLGEISPAGPSFSYAQAAKGVSPSVPSPLPSGKALSETVEKSPRRTSIPESKSASMGLDKPVPKRTASEGRESHGGDLRSGTGPDTTPSTVIESTTSVYLATSQPRSVGQQETVTSAPSSPGYGTASTSTLPKEEDLIETPNGSSDSTWDKQSQTSQNGTKITEKVDLDKEQNATIPWEEESPIPISLKEAPPPAVNFWHQRKEAQDARSKATKQSIPSHQLKSVNPNPGFGSINGAAKGLDAVPESRRQDSKKKAKGNLNEDRNVSGAGKEGSRAVDGRARNADEEKGIHRATRAPEVEKPVVAAAAPPPPPGDEMSWPTPDSAQGEEKKKAQERADKGEKDKITVAKPHGKEKWMPVPYVPSAVFNTPLPPARRGGRPTRGRDSGSRGGSGAHGGNMMHGSNAVEKATAGLNGGSPGTVPNGANERGRTDLSSSKNTANSSRPKRAVSAGPATLREQRKTVDFPMAEKRKEGDIGTKVGNQNVGSAANEVRRTSGATQVDALRANHQPGGVPVNNATQDFGKPSQISTGRDERRQSMSNDAHVHPRSAGAERRSEGSFRAPEYSRDFHGHMPIRERGEGRPERGRGGFRARGTGNHGFPNSGPVNGHSFTNGHTSQYQPSAPSQPPKPQSNYERHSTQSQGASYPSSQPHGRNFRSGSRSQTTPHSATYSRFPSGPHAGAPHLSNLQTDLANQYGYQPGHQGVMSAMPYNPYVDQISLYGMVSMQMEYYFSVDNLCKDMFLRKHMDSQGFVFLSVIAKFNRIRQLTQDMELIKYVCLNSPNIESRLGVDGVDRLRKREGWQQWVLNMEERDPSAQNDGLIPAQQSRIPHMPMFDVPYGFDDRQTQPHRFNGVNPRPDDAPYRSADGIMPSFVPSNSTAMNGSPDDIPVSQTLLSAAVPDFSPGMSSLNARGFSLDHRSHNASSFTDEQVDSLMIVVRKPVNPSNPLPPFHSASSRTFSNGSIDGQTISNELSRFDERQSRSKVNGDTTSEIIDTNRVQGSRSPFHGASSSRQVNTNASPVFWVKDKDTPIDSLPSDLTHESYNVFRRNALQQREQSTIGKCHRDMDILYQFWSHFLIRNFNTRMYEEFRQIAFEDAKTQDSSVGIRNLIQFYDESILGQKVISDEIARDFLDLVRNQNLGTERLAFDKLRAAWRNGAFNMKNRKKIDNIIDAELKAELER